MLVILGDLANPVEVSGDVSIHTRQMWLSAFDAPRNDSGDEPRSIGFRSAR